MTGIVKTRPHSIVPNICQINDGDPAICNSPNRFFIYYSFFLLIRFFTISKEVIYVTFNRSKSEAIIKSGFSLATSSCECFPVDTAMTFILAFLAA